MRRIIGYNGKTLQELRLVFHCSNCGCDFEADYDDYYKVNHPTADTYIWCCYCPSCTAIARIDTI